MNKQGEKITVKPITDKGRQMNTKELSQLLQHNKGIFWSWGASNFKAEGEFTKYFRMKVRGHHHKGNVWIFLNGLDLFDVYFTSTHGTIKEIRNDLYFDMLVNAIDVYVEKIPAYAY